MRRNVVLVLTVTTRERGVEEAASAVGGASVVDAAFEAANRVAGLGVGRVVGGLALATAAMAPARAELAPERRVETCLADKLAEPHPEPAAAGVLGAESDAFTGHFTFSQRKSDRLPPGGACPARRHDDVSRLLDSDPDLLRIVRIHAIYARVLAARVQVIHAILRVHVDVDTKPR